MSKSYKGDYLSEQSQMTRRGRMKKCLAMLPLMLGTIGCEEAAMDSTGLEPLGHGSYAVGATNFQVSPDFADIGDVEMHEILLGRIAQPGEPRFVTDILQHPEDVFTVDVPVPDEDDIYGPASGTVLPVAAYLTFPASPEPNPNRYKFPYHDGLYGEFENMLAPGEPADFADPDKRYPLIILAHGASAHGVYDVRRAHNLSAHGYIVAVLTYGDDRTAHPELLNHHMAYLRPLLTKVFLDALLSDETFGPRIDAENIGIAGHSFGGFTTLAVAGGPFLGNTATVSDSRIKAGSIAAPWVGGNYGGNDLYAFGPDNADLTRVGIPIISFFGTKDESTLASFILPAMRHLSGPTYVIELVDQPHIFEQGSWEDRDNWELIFFEAYLKNDRAAHSMLATGQSMQGGNVDTQLFDYQKLAVTD
jgi:hypothetical protein